MLNCMQKSSDCKSKRFPPIRVRQRSGEGVVRRKRLSKRVFLESPFLLCPLKFVLKNMCEVLKALRGQSRNGLSKNTLLDNRFSARRLRRSFGTQSENDPSGCSRLSPCLRITVSPQRIQNASAPKIPENYSKITIQPTPGLS